MKILIIEDELLLREEMHQWFTLEGIDAITAPDGVAGIEAALSYCPDLIICDITMPRLDGHGVLLELRSNLATIDIPFIFVTARSSHDDIRLGMEMGADDYITKPFTRLELLGAIQTRLNKKNASEYKFQAEVHQLQTALAQKQEQLMIKAKLVAMYSHDFRNPLSIIMSSNSLLRDYTNRMDDKRRLMHFNRVEAAVRQLIQMLDDMLVVAQIETGNLGFNPVLMNVGELLEGIVDEFQAIHSETHHIVYKKLFKGNVMADPRLLHQIAGNLISNAIKYSPRDSEVTILLEGQKKQCILTVKDQGIGIPEADKARLFQEFQRASNVGAVSGTGLGLAIVKQAVDLHSGSINLESESGMGTTVIVAIPV